jgi:FKBP-type peptidyl-prolyl cis-trans isomerase
MLRIRSLLLQLGVLMTLTSKLVVSFAPRSPVLSQSPRQTQQQAYQYRPLSMTATGATSSPFSSTTTTTLELAEGLVKTITKQGNGPALKIGDIATVRYNCYYDDTVFSRSPSQKMVVGDGTMIPGWERAIKTMRVGETSIVQVSDPSLGYGSTGVPPVLPPNAAPLVLELEILDAQPATANIDFDSLAVADKTPRTASDIAAAFEARQAAKALEGPAKEGWEGFIEKAKKFYFFGLFEGETGERPPWFLRPSITFPLAFLFVGAAFYITFAGGAIYERGAQVKDELDEFIVSYNNAAAVGGESVPGSLALASSGLLSCLMLFSGTTGMNF